MPFGEHLRADQNARRAAVHPLEYGFHGTAPRGCIPVQACERRVGNNRPNVSSTRSSPARPGSRVARSCRRSAVRASGRRSDGSAIAQRADAASCARRSGRRAPPNRRRCKTRRRIAAPIQEHDDLTPAVKCRPIACIAGCDSPCSLACLRKSTKAMCGARAAPAAAAARVSHSAPALHFPGFQAKRGRTQHDRQPRALGPPHGQIARRIAKSFMLLV